MSKRTKWLLSIGVIAALVVGWQIVAFAGPVGNASGFEDDDGNLADAAAVTGIDWNSFATTSWTGTAPYRESSKVVSGWTFKGIEDAQVTTTDTAFAGGVKQDHDCATVSAGKAPNKDDLKRIYLSTKNVGGDVFLNLAWVRIPQKTTSSSAHVGFEFNQGETPCPAPNEELVRRTEGDLLFVYDFEGSSTDTPEISMREWITSGTCEVGSSTPPCWGVATNLTDLGFAEGKVNTSDVGSVADQIGPPYTNPTRPPETLGNNEFGEAGINLTDAGVFGPGECRNFGTAYGVSRSSGNSEQAQMKDLVGPADFTLANCATVITRKVTDPAGDTTTNFNYTTNVTTSPATTTSPFQLKDGQSKTITNVTPNTNLNVTEGNPGPGYALTSIDCSASSVPAANRSTNTTTRAVTFSIAAGETLDCTFTNTLQRGNIVIDKVTDPSGDPQSFAFTLTGGPSNLNQSFNLTDQATPHNSGAVLPGSGYNAAETVPAGWDLTNTSCSDGSPVTNIDVSPNETVTCTFTNTKRGNIVIDKVTDPSGDPQSFEFSLTGGPTGSTINQNFSLTDAADPHNSGAIKPGNNYVAAETVPPGWELDDADCDDTNSTVENIDVSPGETVTCTFTNLKQTTGISTAQSYTPQDTATITGTGSGAFNGTVDFELYKGTACTGTPVYFEYDVALSGTTSGSTASTTNGAAASQNHAAEYTIEAGAEEGNYVWKVSYSGDPNHPDKTSCVEESSVSIDNDNADPTTP
jgi:hypothetical protein